MHTEGQLLKFFRSENGMKRHVDRDIGIHQCNKKPVTDTSENVKWQTVNFSELLSGK